MGKVKKKVLKKLVVNWNFISADSGTRLWGYPYLLGFKFGIESNQVSNGSVYKRVGSALGKWIF